MQTIEHQIEQYSVQAEQSIIGAMLLDNDALDRVGDLRAEHFYRGDHRTIFAEIVAQIAAGKPCDVISLFDSLASRIDDCLPYLNSMVQNTPSSANIARHGQLTYIGEQTRFENAFRWTPPVPKVPSRRGVAEHL